jgi:hypothetical protein
MQIKAAAAKLPPWKRCAASIKAYRCITIEILALIGSPRRKSNTDI